ncbi:Glycosyl transferase family 14 [Arabidopsis suecica]|uniref:Glycosyl transferase family 14 n=1 Tax=Arabidopsis suecica TaxID=45249 RepID=A0A8T2H1U2_ARASU|nr:Glycosyl transferase family 14 [Arabidopsis suecica]
MARGGKEEGEKHIGLLKLAQTLSFLLVIFMAGIIIGLAASSHIDRYFNSLPRMFSSTTNLQSIPFSTPDYSNCTIIHRDCTGNDENDDGGGGVKAEKPKDRDCWSIDGFVRPENLSHGMSDDELFWRASMVPVKEEYPYDRVPKVAFMFLTRGPLPMLPLWEKFFKGNDKYLSVYVHTPPGYDMNVSRDSPFYDRQIPSQRVEWGSPLLTDAEKRLLANALLDFSNERFVLLSESCVPVYNFSTVYTYLINSAYSFVDSYDEPTRYGRGRYSRKMLPDIKLHHWRKGSQWFEVNRKIAIYIISDSKYYSLFKQFCRPACYPDEHYIPTFLNMFHGSMNANRSVTWVDWSIGGPHPATYAAANITEGFLQSIRKNETDCLYNEEPTSLCFLFARKFSPSALAPLMNLSSTVMGF